MKGQGSKKKKEVCSVNGGAEKKKNKIYKTKIKTTYSFSFHIKSDEKYTKIENNYSRRHGRYGGIGWEGILFFLFFFSISLNVLSLPGYFAAEQCNILGLFKASSTRWSSTPSTTTSLTQPTKPVLQALGNRRVTASSSRPPGGRQRQRLTK